MVEAELPGIQQAPENVFEGFRRLRLAVNQLLQLVKLVGRRLTAQATDVQDADNFLRAFLCRQPTLDHAGLRGSCSAPYRR